MQMTDEQVLTLGVAIVLPAAALIYSNSRVSDVGKRIDDMKERLLVEIAKAVAEIKIEISQLDGKAEAIRKDMNHGFERTQAALKTHELEHHK